MIREALLHTNTPTHALTHNHKQMNGYLPYEFSCRVVQLLSYRQ